MTLPHHWAANMTVATRARHIHLRMTQRTLEQQAPWSTVCTTAAAAAPPSLHQHHHAQQMHAWARPCAHCSRVVNDQSSAGVGTGSSCVRARHPGQFQPSVYPFWQASGQSRTGVSAVSGRFNRFECHKAWHDTTLIITSRCMFRSIDQGQGVHTSRSVRTESVAP